MSQQNQNSGLRAAAGDEVIRAIDEYLTTPEKGEEIITRLGVDLGVTGTANVFREALRLAKEAAARSRAHAPGKAGDREGLDEAKATLAALPPELSPEDHAKALRSASSRALGEGASKRAERQLCKAEKIERAIDLVAALAPFPTGNEAPRGEGAEDPAWTAFQVWIAEAKPKVWQEAGFRAGYAAALAPSHAGDATGRALSQILAEAPEHEPVDPTPDAEATEGEAYHRDLAWWEAAQLIRDAVAEDAGAPQAAVPAGWKLVPEKLTYPMVEVMFRTTWPVPSLPSAQALWDDGLAAAPPPPVSTEPDSRAGAEEALRILRKAQRSGLMPGCMMPDGAEPCAAFTEYDDAIRDAIEALRPSPPTASGAAAPVGEAFQARALTLFEAAIGDDPSDLPERVARFAEEALELVQALHMTEDDARRVLEYVFGRPRGEPAQEFGGTLATLAVLASYAGEDLMRCGEADIARWTDPAFITRLRMKRAGRHGRGPLPGATPTPAPHPVPVGQTTGEV